MKIGVYMFSTDYSIGIVELARALEERGYASLFVPEHTHIPTSRRSPWPGGAELPREYSHTLDPFVGLAAAAAATEKLRLGTGIMLLTERDPIVTAKAVATLDLISNGRLDFGIGAGWNAEEMENHGTAFDTRFRVMVDRAKAMQAIWTQDEASYDGEFVKFQVGERLRFDVEIKGKKAKLLTCCFNGPQRLALLDPEGCLDPVVVDCPD